MKVQVEKIVGSQEAKSWSQVHIYEPKDHKENSHGSLFACISFTVLKEGVDVSSFGKEIIQRLHESYYSSSGDSRLKQIKLASEEIINEFSERVVIKLQVAVYWQKAIFLLINSGTVYLARNDELFPILSGGGSIKIASGFVKSNDRFVFGSQEFFKLVTKGTLQAALGLTKINKTIDILTPLIHGHDSNSQAVALLLEFSDDQETSGLESGSKSHPDEVGEKSSKSSSKVPNKIKQVFTGINSLRFRLQKPDIKRSDFIIKDESQAKKAKKNTLLVAIVLVVLLAVSLFFGNKKRKTDQYQALRDQVIQPALSAIDEAKSLKEDNPLQAKNILLLGQEKLEQEASQQEDIKLLAEINAVAGQIESELALITGMQKVDQAELFLDLSLIKEDYSAKRMSFNGQKLVISSAQDKEIVLVDIESKNHQRERPANINGLLGAGLGNNSQRLFFLDKDKLSVNNLAQDEVLQELENSWGTSRKLVVFEGNAYVLQSQAIQKFVGIDSGLGDARSYLKEEPDWQGKDMAIDGFVWVLTEDGLVYKYISGKRDTFVLLGVGDLSNDLLLYTDKNLDNVYLLDKTNTKVVQIDKVGEYQSSYLWPGMAGVHDFVVSEENGQIYLLTKDRVYTIKINAGE